MGPFVPDIITDQLNLVFGFLLGVVCIPWLDGGIDSH